MISSSPENSYRWTSRTRNTAREAAGLRLFRPFKSKSPDHGVLAEAGSHIVDRVLGLRRAAIDEVGGIGLIRRGKRTDADAKQAKPGAAGLVFEQAARRGENTSRQLRRRLQ